MSVGGGDERVNKELGTGKIFSFNTLIEFRR